MGALATAPARRPETGAPATEHFAAPLFEAGGLTLEDRILDVWEDLTLGSAAECPVCAGELRAGGCKDCGAELT